jgi:hypothetical protein
VIQLWNVAAISLTIDSSVLSIVWACSIVLRWQIRLVRKLMPKGILGFQAVCPDLGFV